MLPGEDVAQLTLDGFKDWQIANLMKLRERNDRVPLENTDFERHIEFWRFLIRTRRLGPLGE